MIIGIGGSYKFHLCYFGDWDSCKLAVMCRAVESCSFQSDVRLYRALPLIQTWVHPFSVPLSLGSKSCHPGKVHFQSCSTLLWMYLHVFLCQTAICILHEGSFMLGTALFVNLIQLQDMVKINKRCNSEPSELYLFCLFIFSVWSKAYAALSSHESMWQYVQKLCHLPAQWKDIGNQIPCAFIIFFLFFPYLQREDLNL